MGESSKPKGDNFSQELSPGRDRQPTEYMRALTYDANQYKVDRKNIVAYTIDIVERNLARGIKLGRWDVTRFFEQNVKDVLAKDDERRTELLQQVRFNIQNTVCTPMALSRTGDVATKERLANMILPHSKPVHVLVCVSETDSIRVDGLCCCVILLGTER